MNYFYKSMNHQRDKNFIFVTFTKKDEWFDINYSIYFYLHSKLDALGIFKKIWNDQSVIGLWNQKVLNIAAQPKSRELPKEKKVTWHDPIKGIYK
jgi:hypothetical protein